jgi:hypothetical protein
MSRRLCIVGPDAADKVRLGVNQRPQQIVQPRVKVLRQRRNWIVAVQPAHIVSTNENTSVLRKEMINGQNKKRNK